MLTELRRNYPHLLPLVAILLIAATLRISLLTDYRFHPDEALFATLGRLIISGEDVLLTQTNLLVDKPPLFYYTLASGISISWGEELAARLPGLWTSVISIALIARLARRLWESRRVGILAAGSLAISPFAILFSSTAFADPVMVMWILAAAVTASDGRFVWSGILSGLALATKPTAVFALPIVLIAGLVSIWGSRDWLSTVFRVIIGLSPVLIAIAGWDYARGADSFFISGIAFNNPGRLIRAEEIIPRLVGWSTWFQYIVGTPILTVIAVGLAMLTPVFLQSRLRFFARLLIAYIIISFAFLWLVAFPVLDRYLLAIVPVIAILLGVAGDRLVNYLRYARKARQRVLVALVSLIVVGGFGYSAIVATRGAYPVGGDHGRFDGVTEVGELLKERPAGTVVYYDTLGWSLSYYAFDTYVYLAPFGSPYALQTDLQTHGQGDSQRLLVLPGWESHRETLFSVQRAGFQSEPVLQTVDRNNQTSFVVYQLIAND